ncbi:hypothetical protein DMH25_15150 [Streptomyces sp. WAC 01325]|nr:hypothetical protein DMH25_15150 [Streptomyces sp. WAC 01325]
MIGLGGLGLGNVGGVSGSGFGNLSAGACGAFGRLARIGDHVAGLDRGRLGRLGNPRQGALGNLRSLGDRNGFAGGRFSGHERLGSLRNVSDPSDLGALSTDRTLSDPGVTLRRLTDARNLLATVPAGHGPGSRHGPAHRRGVSGSGLAPTIDRVTGDGGHDSRTLHSTGNSPVALDGSRGHRPLRAVMTGHRLGNRRDTGSGNSSRLLPRVHTLLRSGPGHPSHRRLCHTDRVLRGHNRFGSRRLRARRHGGRSLGGGAPGRRRLRDRGVEVLGAHRDRAGLSDRCADGAAVGEGADRARGGVRDGRAEVQGAPRGDRRDRRRGSRRTREADGAEVDRAAVTAGHLVRARLVQCLDDRLRHGRGDLVAPGTLGAGHQEVFVLGGGLGEVGVRTVRRGGARLLHRACALRQSLARDLAGVGHAYPSPIG